jgi:hypothetical protein
LRLNGPPLKKEKEEIIKSEERALKLHLIEDDKSAYET